MIDALREEEAQKALFARKSVRAAREETKNMLKSNAALTKRVKELLGAKKTTVVVESNGVNILLEKEKARNVELLDEV